MCQYCYPIGEAPRNLRGYRPEDEQPARYKKPSRRKKSVKKMPGCFGNSGGSHIYVWVIEHYPLTRWVKGDTVNERGYRGWVPIREGCRDNYRSICIGCGKSQPGKWGWHRDRKNTVVYDVTCDYGCRLG